MKRRGSKRLRLFTILMTAVFCATCFYMVEVKRTVNHDQYASNNSDNSEDQMTEDTTIFAGNGSAKKNTGNKKKQYVVVVDAGHGGIDVGATGPAKSKEKDNTLAVALKLGKVLESKGIKVVYTRKSDKTNLPNSERENLQARTSIANNSGADLFISIHNNSSPFKSIRGVESYYFIGSAKSKTLANNIQKQIAASLKLTDRKVRFGTFYVLRNTKATSVLIELGFISNKDEEAILKSSKYQDKYAGAIAAGIFNYLNIK